MNDISGAQWEIIVIQYTHKTPSILMRCNNICGINVQCIAYLTYLSTANKEKEKEAKMSLWKK